VANQGIGSDVPIPAGVDPEQYDRWYVPRVSPEESGTFLKLVMFEGQQRWADQSGRILKGTDPVELEPGVVISLSDMAHAIFSVDYAAIVRNGLEDITK